MLVTKMEKNVIKWFSKGNNEDKETRDKEIEDQEKTDNKDKEVERQETKRQRQPQKGIF